MLGGEPTRPSSSGDIRIWPNSQVQIKNRLPTQETSPNRCTEELSSTTSCLPKRLHTKLGNATIGSVLIDGRAKSMHVRLASTVGIGPDFGKSWRLSRGQLAWAHVPS